MQVRGGNQEIGHTSPTFTGNSGIRSPEDVTSLSDLDSSISQFANKVNLLPKMQGNHQKKKLLEELKKQINEILEHDDFDFIS